MAANAARLNVLVNYNVNQASVNALKKSLQDLQKIKIGDFQGSTDLLKHLKDTASLVQQALERAFNVNLGSLNVKTFNLQLQSAGLSVNKIYSLFSKAGTQGQVAFSQMTSSVLTTNLQLKLTKSLIDSMGLTMANTVKWGIASSIMNQFTGAVKNAFSYVKSLDSALTDIRIVTGDSTDQMKLFAVQANNAAQALGRSTMDYTKAALTFYQQGLDDQSVQARTEATLKAQNITGAGDLMADYLTAVWNGYRVANEEALLYVDKLAAVADSSASNMSLLAVAMSKVASTARAMGVDVDSLNAQIATIVGTTRQAPESVGNALKTIYARINDIATGADDALVSLGNYSLKMAQVGFSVLDANGNLRDTGLVIDLIGGKWLTLSREQQIYLARTMAGQRQYNNLIALFDNWGRYTDLVNVSLDSQGTLMLKNSRYMDSLEAKMQQLGAAGEKFKSALIDEDTLKRLVLFGTGAVSLLANFVLSLGGGGNALLTFGSILTQVFSGTISKEIDKIVTNINNIKNNAQILQRDIEQTSLFGQSKGYKDGTIQEMVDAKKDIQQYYSVISKEQVNEYNLIVRQIGASKLQTLILDLQIQKYNTITESIRLAAKTLGTDFDSNLLNIDEGVETLKDLLKGISYLDLLDADVRENLTSTLSKLKNALGETAVEALPGFKAYDDILKEINNTELVTIGQTNSLKQAAEAALGQVDNYLKTNILLVQIQALQALAKLKMAKQAAEDFVKGTRQVFDIKNIVQTISSIGQLTAGFNTLSNVVKNVWSNKNLSGAQKLLQTLTGMGTAVPMIITSFNRLKTVTTQLSGRFITFNDVQQKSNALQKANADLLEIINLKKKVDNNLQVYYNGAIATTTVLLQALAEAKREQTKAQNAFNIAVKANPLGQILMVITAVITAIVALVKIYDALTMSTKLANLALDKFNDKQKLLVESTKKYNQVKSNLDPKEWELLQKNAGAYNSTINKLTESEKLRYYELSNLIAEYNLDAVVGYDAQGNAIIEMNHNLLETIALLREKHQLEIENTYGSKEAKLARRAEQVLYNNAVLNQKLAQNRVNVFSGIRTEENYELYNAEEQNFQRVIGQAQEKLAQLRLDLGEEYQDQIYEYQDQLNQILSLGFGKLALNKEGLNELEANLKELAKKGLYENLNYFNLEFNVLKSYSENLKFANEELLKANEEVRKTGKLDMSIFFGELSLLANNDEYYAIKEAGSLAIDSILSSYIEGLLIDRSKYKLKEDIYQDIISKYITGEDGILTKIQEAFYNIDYSGDKGLGINFELYINYAVQRLNNVNFSSYDLYSKTVAEYITKIINDNPAILALLKDSPELQKSIELYLANAFNLENVNWSTVTLKASISTGLEQGFLRINLEVTIRYKEYLGTKGQFTTGAKLDITPYLNADLTRDQIEKIINKVKLLLMTSGDLQDYIQLIQSDVITLTSVSSRINTIDLLGRQASGEKLSGEDLESLQKGMALIQNAFPGLRGSFQILQQEWLQGTSIYQKSLLNVKNTILLSFDLLKDLSGNLSLLIKTELLGNLNKIITTSEDLQNVANKFFTSAADQGLFGLQLVRLASQYETCTDEVNNYLFALNSMNRLTQEATQFQLELALRSAENAEATGLQAEQIEAVALQMMNENMLLAENAELASDAATRYIRLNNAVADIYNNLLEYKKLQLELQAAEQATGDSSEALMAILADDSLYSTFKNLKESTADLLDTSLDLLGDNWIAENINKIMLAADKGGLSLLQLRQSAQLEIFANLGIDTSGFEMGTDEALAKINEMRDGQALDVIGTADIDILTFIQQLVTAMLQAGMAQEDIEAALSGIGLDVDLAPYEEGLNAAIDQAGVAGQKASDYFASNAGVDVKTKSLTSLAQDLIDNVGYDVEPVNVPGTVAYPVISSVDTLFGPVPNYTGQLATATISYPAFRTKANSNPITATKQTTATGLLVIGATKSSGGKISHVNSPTRRAARATPKSSKGSGSKGGSAKQPTQVKPVKNTINTKTKAAEYDPYLQNTKQYLRQNNILKTLEKRLKNIVGKDRLKNLQNQNKALQEQLKILRLRQKISENEKELNTTAWYREQIKKLFGTNRARFDEDGQIADRNKLLQYAAAQYNKAEADAIKAYLKQLKAFNTWITNVYNKASAARQEQLKAEKQLKEDTLKNEKEKAEKAISSAELTYKKRIDFLNKYEKALEEDLKYYEQYLDYIDQIRDKHLETLTATLLLRLDAGLFERDWLDFEKKFIKKISGDDILSNMKHNIKELMTYINSELITSNHEAITKIKEDMAELQTNPRGYLEKLYADDETWSWDYLKDEDRETIIDNTLAKLRDELKEATEKLMKSLSSVQDMINDIKDDYLDKIDEANDKMKLQVEQYERIDSLVLHDVKLLDLLYGDKGLLTREKYYELQRENNLQLLETLRQQLQFWRDRMSQEMIGSPAWEKFKQNLDDVIDEMNSKLEKVIDDRTKQWENRVNIIINNLNNTFTNGLGTDYLEEQWDYMSDFDDKFLDTFNSTVGVQDVERLYNQALEGVAGNPKAQQRINNLMKEQLKILKEKDNLTEYDLERAKALLQVEQARMDLEDARNNKTKMRLRRDSQGNYTYQYVADEEKLEDLLQALADAQANLYNMDKDHYKQNLEDMNQITKDFIAKEILLRQELAKAEEMQDEKEVERIQNRINLMNLYYDKMSSALYEDNQYLLDYLSGSFSGGMGIDRTAYSVELWALIMRKEVPYVNSTIQDMADNINAAGGLIEASAGAVADIVQEGHAWQNDVNSLMNTAGTSAEDIGNVVNALGQALDRNILTTRQLITANLTLLESLRQQIAATQELLSGMEDILKQSLDFENLLNNLREAHDIVQDLHGVDLNADVIPVAQNNIDTTFNSPEEAKAYYELLARQAQTSFDAGELLTDNDIAQTLSQYLKSNLMSTEELANLIRVSEYIQSITSSMGNLFSHEITSLDSGIGEILSTTTSENGTIDQNVHIDASFPNVTDHNLIEQAFNNLVNIASMYASKRY